MEAVEPLSGFNRHPPPLPLLLPPALAATTEDVDVVAAARRRPGTRLAITSSVVMAHIVPALSPLPPPRVSVPTPPALPSRASGSPSDPVHCLWPAADPAAKATRAFSAGRPRRCRSGVSHIPFLAALALISPLRPASRRRRRASASAVASVAAATVAVCPGRTFSSRRAASSGSADAVAAAAATASMSLPPRPRCALIRFASSTVAAYAAALCLESEASAAAPPWRAPHAAG